MTAVTTADLRVDADYALFSEIGRKSRPMMAAERRLSYGDLHSIRSVGVHPSPFQPAFSQVARYRELLADWDSYGAQRIEQLVIETANRILDLLSDSALESATAVLAPYHISPVPNGGLQMEWRRDGRSFELWIAPDGSLEAVVDEPLAGLAERSYITVASAAAEIEAVVG